MHYTACNFESCCYILKHFLNWHMQFCDTIRFSLEATPQFDAFLSEREAIEYTVALTETQEI